MGKKDDREIFMKNLINMTPNIKFDIYAGDNVYVKINELYNEKPELLEKRKQILQELEKESEIQRV